LTSFKLTPPCSYTRQGSCRIRATALALFALALFAGGGLSAVALGALLELLGFRGLFALTGCGLFAFTALSLKPLSPQA